MLIKVARFSTAIATVVTIAEILKNNGLATEKSKISYSCLSLLISVSFA